MHSLISLTPSPLRKHSALVTIVVLVWVSVLRCAVSSRLYEGPQLLCTWPHKVLKSETDFPERSITFPHSEVSNVDLTCIWLYII